MNSRIFLPALFALALCVSPAARAGNATPKPRIHHHTVIETVSADSITINQGTADKTFKITKNTEITFRGETTTADQLQAGMRVSVVPDSVDPTIAGQIEASDPPKEPSSPKALK